MQTWPLAVAQAQISPWPQETSRPQTSAHSLLPSPLREFVSFHRTRTILSLCLLYPTIWLLIITEPLCPVPWGTEQALVFRVCVKSPRPACGSLSPSQALGVFLSSLPWPQAESPGPASGFILLFMFLCVCAYGYLQKSEEDSRFRVARVIDSCQSLGMGAKNSGPLEEHQMPLAGEPSLWYPE